MRDECDITDRISHCMAHDLQDSDICTKCEFGFFWNPSERHCLPCEENGLFHCAECTHDGYECINCLAGYDQLDNFICYSDHCQVRKNVFECEVCEPEHYLTWDIKDCISMHEVQHMPILSDVYDFDEIN